MPIQSIPHGWYSVVPTVLTTLGWMCGLFQDGCDFVRVEGEIVERIASQPNAPYLEAGRKAYREPRYNAKTDSWEVEYIGQCLTYREEEVEMDIWWNVAKGFDFASLVLGGTCSLFLCFSVCCVFSRGTWRLAGFVVLLACLFQAASFLWFKTDLCQKNDCSLFWGSNADIAACVLWLVAAILIFSHYPVPKDHMHTREAGDGLVVEGRSRQSHVYDSNSAQHNNYPVVEPSTVHESPTSIPTEEEQNSKEEHWLSTQGSGGEEASCPAGQDSGENSAEQDHSTSGSTTPAQIV